MEVTKAGAGARGGAEVWASKTALKICYKSSSKYLEITIAATGATVIGGFDPESLVGYLKNSDLEDGEELERAMIKCSQRGQPWSQIEGILMETFF